MRIQPGKMISLGYGRYFRSDKIVGLEPIEEGRGAHRRTHVHIEGRADPLVASRSETAILKDLILPSEMSPEADRAYLLLENVLSDLANVGPMLRLSIANEAGLDINALEHKIKALLLEPSELDPEEAAPQTFLEL